MAQFLIVSVLERTFPVEGQGLGPYTTWQQVSGYFDGDGTPMLTLTMYTVIPSIDWADSYKLQLDSVRSFLLKNGFRPTRTYTSDHKEKPVWHLRLYERGGLVEALNLMLPHLFKKYLQVRACLDYFENRITGEQLVEAFNEATRTGARSGLVKAISMPYTREQGHLQARSIVAKGRHAADVLTPQVLDEIATRRLRGENLREISFEFHVSRTSIRRAILRHRSGGISTPR